MLFRAEFLIRDQSGRSSTDSLYIVAEDRETAIDRTLPFAEKVFHGMDVSMRSVVRIPNETIITCLNYMEFIPKGANAEEPIIFSEPSKLVS